MPDGEIILQASERRSRGNVFAIMADNHNNGLKITPETSIAWRSDGSRHGGCYVVEV